MRELRSTKFLLVLAISIPLSFIEAYGQEATHVAFEQSSDASNNPVYKITYDLESPFDNIATQVRVNFKSPQGTTYLKQVSGDVGDLVFPGPKKTIIWNYVEELVHFSGDVNLTIEVTPLVKVASGVRRSKKMDVSLAPSLGPNKNYTTKLFLNKAEVKSLAESVSSDNSSSVSIPKKTPARKNYQIAISDGENTYFSNAFRVRPKIGYGWKAAAVLVIPAAIIISNIIEDNKPLPGPPSHN